MSDRDSSSNGEPPCRIEVKAMPKKGKRKLNKKQWPDNLRWVTYLAAATYWVVRTILLLWDWFTR